MDYLNVFDSRDLKNKSDMRTIGLSVERLRVEYAKASPRFLEELERQVAVPRSRNPNDEALRQSPHDSTSRASKQAIDAGDRDDEGQGKDTKEKLFPDIERCGDQHALAWEIAIPGQTGGKAFSMF